MRLASELYTLPRHVVKAIMENNMDAQQTMKAFTQIWHMTQNVIDICSAILRSPVDDETGN